MNRPNVRKSLLGRRVVDAAEKLLAAIRAVDEADAELRKAMDEWKRATNR